MREKALGIWQTWTWRQMYDEVRALAGGLAAMGLARGDKVAIIGDNRPHLYWTMTATQCLGGVPVPLYQDAVAEEMQFVLEHAETRFAVVEDQEQVDKLLAVQERCRSWRRLSIPIRVDCGITPHLICMPLPQCKSGRRLSCPSSLCG